MHALRSQQENETKELGDAVVALPAKDKAAADALAAKQAAEALLNEARTTQMSEAEVFKKVRGLDARLGEQNKQLGEKDKAIGEVEKQGNAYKSHIENDEQALKKSHAALDAVHEYRKKHAADAALLADFTAIARGFATIRDIEAKHIKAGEALAVAAGKKQSALAASSKTETDHEKFRRELEKGQDELKRLTDEITSVLKGRDIGQWRSETDALKDRERLLLQTGETIERIDKTCTALTGLKTGVETLKAAEISISDEIKSCAAKKALLERDIGNLEAQVSVLSRIRDLEEERKRLEDGKPCPLCGATDHPYAQGNVPVLNEAEAALKKTKDEFKAVSETLSKLESGQVKTAAEIRHTEKAMEEKKAALDADEKQCAAFLSNLNIQAADAERAEKVREELAGVRVKITETAGIVSAAEKKSKKEKPAQKALEEIRGKFDTSGTALQDARLKLEAAVLEHERLIKDCAALAEESEKARATARKDVEPFRIVEVQSKNLDGILEDLTRRKDTWQAKEDEKTAHEKKINDLKAAIEKNKALLGSLEEDLTARCKDRDDLNAEYESLCASRRQLFGEKNADQEEKRLVDAVKKAESAFERARESYILLEKEIDALKEKIASLKVKTGNRATELAQAEQKLIARFKTAGFEDESGYLSSCLSEEEREILAEREKSLIKEKTELEARRKDKSEALASEREKK